MDNFGVSEQGENTGKGQLPEMLPDG